MSAGPPVPEPPSPRLLAGRRALVTGASTGIGREIARELGAQGAAVAVGHLRDAGGAEEVAAAVRADGAGAAAVAVDVTSEADVARAFAEAGAALGGLDLVVSNAGVQSTVALVDMPLEEWRRVVEVNLTGAFLVCREAARAMRGRPGPRTIVGITSVHDRMPWERHAHYSAAKAGMRMLVESIAKELAPQGIRVAAVAPGAIATARNRALADPRTRGAVEAQIPMGRVGAAREVARAVAWLSSEQASYVTGATLAVDGGMTLFAPGSG